MILSSAGMGEMIFYKNKNQCNQESHSPKNHSKVSVVRK